MKCLEMGSGDAMVLFFWIYLYYITTYFLPLAVFRCIILRLFRTLLQYSATVFCESINMVSKILFLLVLSKYSCYMGNVRWSAVIYICVGDCVRTSMRTVFGTSSSSSVNSWSKQVNVMFITVEALFQKLVITVLQNFISRIWYNYSW